MSDNIPFEIQMEIIKKVDDFKSLIRFRGVSKPWKSFFESSEFIAGFGSRDTQPQSLLLRYKDNSKQEKYVSFVDAENDTSFTQQQQQNFAPKVTDLMKQFNDLRVIGSSHGLLCLRSDEKGMFVVWNHSLKISVGFASPAPCWPRNHFGYAFAVCPGTHDPTIIKVMNYNDVYFFTLTSKTWTRLNGARSRTRRSSLFVIDRFVYWVAYEINRVDGAPSPSFDFMMMSFDLVSKDMKAVDIPHSCINHGPNSGICYISQLLESLVLFVSGTEVGVPVYRVWKMEHAGYFTKLFTIKTPGSTIYNILGFRKNGEVVMETQKEDEEFAALEVYDTCSERISNLGIYGEGGSFFMNSYKESLLLMDHPDGCVYPELIDHGEDGRI